MNEAFIIINEMLAVSPAMKQELHVIFILCKLLLSRVPACCRRGVRRPYLAREAFFP